MPKLGGSVVLIVLVLLGSLAPVRQTPESLAAPRPTFRPNPTIPIVATRVPPLPSILRANDDLFRPYDSGSTIFAGNVKTNDGTTSCGGTLIVISAESNDFPIQIDDVGNVFFTDPGSGFAWQTTYYLRCSTFNPATSRFIVTTSNTATVRVELYRASPEPSVRASASVRPSPSVEPSARASASARPSSSATATRPARTPTPFPSIRVPTRTPVASVTPQPTIIIRFTPTPAVSPRPTIRPIGTIRPTRPATSPTITPRP